MAIVLPHRFGDRVNDLDLYIREAQASSSRQDRARLRRLALQTACDLLRSCDSPELDQTLKDIVHDRNGATQHEAKELLEDVRSFDFFLHRIEDGLFEVAGLLPRTRARVLEILLPLGTEAAASLGDLRYQQLASGFRELTSEVCQLKDALVSHDSQLENNAHENATHTRWVNTIGSVTIMVNAAAAFATASSLLFLPAVSAAAAVASVALGGVAQNLKPR